MALEEIRFLASISLAVPPADGMAYVYPLNAAFDVELGLPDGVVLELARKHVERVMEEDRRRDVVLPPVAGSLTDHLLMRGPQCVVAVQHGVETPGDR